MLFIDESGSITKSSDPKKRYFIISMVETERPLHVRRNFYKFKTDYLKHHSSLKAFDPKLEMKGSEMPIKMKKYILSKLIESTDVSFHYVVIDNWHLADSFHRDVELCFNYVIGRYLKRFLDKYFDTSYDLKMVLDERNCTVKSLNSLRDYLKIELCLNSSIINDVKECQYADSKKYAVLQVADVFANLVWRSCKDEALGNSESGNIKLLNELFPGDNMYFPYKENTLGFYHNNNNRI